MADYPNSVYNPRTKTNRSGVDYDPTKENTIFAEDINNLDTEVVAIEEDLEKVLLQGGDGPVFAEEYFTSKDWLLKNANVKPELYSDFGVNSLNMPENMTDISTFVIHNGTIFFFSNDNPSKCFYYKLTIPQSYGYITLPSGTANIKKAIRVGNYIYAVCNIAPYRVIKIDPVSLSVVGYIDGDSGENYATCCCYGNSTLYIGLATAPGQVIAIGLDDFTKSNSYTYASGFNSVSDVFFMYDYLYIAFFTSPACGIKADKNILAPVNTIVASLGSEYPSSITTDGNCLIVGFSDTVGHIAKLSFDDLTVIDLFSVGGSNNQISKVQYSGGDLYVCRSYDPVKIDKVDLQTGDVLGTLQFPSGISAFTDLQVYIPGMLVVANGDTSKFYTALWGNLDLDIT